MGWKFNPITLMVDFVKTQEQIIVTESFFDLGGGDLSIDGGLRENALSSIDQGTRLDGNIQNS